MFFDWDDTLFPTTDIFDNIGIAMPDPRKEMDVEALPPALEKMLQEWRVALFHHIDRACSLSEHVVVVTNARKPWVTQCLDAFAPALKPLFTRVRVKYADDSLSKHDARYGRRIRSTGVVQCTHNNYRHHKSCEEIIEGCVQGKLAAMHREAKLFYSQSKREPWHNILSMGDAQFERLACQELAWLSPPAAETEPVRIKTILVPASPSITELTLRLRMSTCLMLAHVRFDGDIDCDLDQDPDPMQHIADTLEIPELGALKFPDHAFGRSSNGVPPEQHVQNTALAALQMLVDCKNKLGTSSHSR